MNISNPFGFVAGRWAFATADTASDPDRAPDYVPASGATITFTPETPRQVVPDTPGWTGVINKRVVGKLNEEGRLVDAEGHNHFALGVGTYAVHYYFGNDIKWPSHRIQVTEAHTASNPLWLPPMPAPPPVPDAVNRTIQVPADGTDGQVLVWDGGAFSWDFPPEGPRGPKGDMDAEQLAGAPRLTNLVHDITWVVERDAAIDSQAARTVDFTATAQNGIIRWGGVMTSGKSYYFTAEVKTTSDQVYLGSSVAPVYHSGSGDWERLSGMKDKPQSVWLTVRDERSSGWDQIEVRDAVLIDLTEVFGDGREPTKEYMDEVLAKHGGYIDAVDQFAFGDALQSLTVAGPGMTLRHDNSVGERIFLDHPGGSTMLYGDTGWRTLYAWDETGTLTTGDSFPNNIGPIPGRAGFIQIRRTTNTVYLDLHRVRADTTNATIPLPGGFRPGGAGVKVGLPGGMSSTRVSVILGSGDYGVSGATGQYSDHLAFAVNSYTWPTTLPGTPA